MDFHGNAEEAAEHINDNVSVTEVTRNLIKDVVGVRSFDLTVDVVLANAIYFKGKRWP